MRIISVALSLALALGAAGTSLAVDRYDEYDDYDDDAAYESCDIYRRKHREAARSLKNLEREEIAPLRRRRDRIQKEIRLRTQRPAQLEREIQRLAGQAGQIEAQAQAGERKRDSLLGEADALESSGKTKKAGKVRKQAFKGERKNIESLAAVERMNAEAEAKRQEAEEIRTAEPPLEELRATLEQIDRDLADVDGMRRRRGRHVHFLKRTLGMCESYRELSRGG
jgi:chromosome segregation ATPase